MAELGLEERLASYGEVLSDELAAWPSFNPAAVAAASSPLLLLRRWRGRWLGAGHRPLFALGAIAAAAAGIVVTLVVLLGLGDTSSGDTPDVTAAVTEAAPAAEAAPAVDAASSDPDPGSETVPASTTSDAVDDGAARDGGEINSDSPAEPVTTNGGTDAATGQAGDPAMSAPSVRCRDGLLVNGRCRIATEPSPSQRADACVEQGGIDDEEAGCFRVVDAAASCPTGFELAGSECTRRTSPSAPVLTCPDGSDLEGDSCIRTVAPTIGCSDGLLIDELCRVERPPATGGELSCAGGGPVVNGICTVTVAADCGSAIAVAGGCAQPAPTEKRETCPADTSLANGSCIPDGGCTPTSTDTKTKHHDHQRNDDCGTPPLTEVVCSATGQPAADGDCFTTVAATCPGGHQLQGSRCIKEFAAAFGAYRCPAGQLLIGTSCFDELPTEVSCVEGALVDDTCVITSPAQVAGPQCPAGASLVGEACVSRATAEVACPVGVLSASGCQIAIPIDDAELCGPGTEFDLGWCVRFEDPIAS